MTTEEKLKKLIESRYGSLNNFSVTHKIPYSTIKSVLDRGVNNSTIQSIIKICRPLNLDIDALSEGIIKSKRPIADDESFDVRTMITDAKFKMHTATKITVNGKIVNAQEVQKLINSLEFEYEILKLKSENDSDE